MIEKAQKLIESGRVERLSYERFNVIGDHGTYTVVRTYDGKVSCTCQGFLQKGRCSHAAAIVILFLQKRKKSL
jgi:hypothetical protein